MKFVRFEGISSPVYGIVDGDTVKGISNSPVGMDFEETGETYLIGDVRILAPNPMPGKMLCLALNYASHLLGADIPDRPEPFYKNCNAIIGPGDPILIPQDAGLVVCESELVAIIGKTVKNVSEKDALDYVFGYTCGNDVSARPWQRGDLSWWRAKSSDTFAPIGPFIATGLDPSNLGLSARINGRTVQDASTSDLIHDVPTIIEFVSSVMTLEVGDIIMTGTPGEPEDINPGDTVEIEVEGVGILRNSVAEEV